VAKVYGIKRAAKKSNLHANGSAFA
jgi:hypothetical protein